MNKNPQYIRYTKKMLAASCGARSQLDFQKFQQNYSTPWSEGRVGGPENFSRYYRVADITDPRNALLVPARIDHHLACAWSWIWVYARDGYAPQFVPGADSPGMVCEMIMAFPEGLRERFDAVLEGLRIEIDPAGAYEAEFVSWSRAWYAAMSTIYSATKGQTERRLRMYRQAAEEAFPALIEWVEKLRYGVFDGGYDSNWSTGDMTREEVEE